MDHALVGEVTRKPDSTIMLKEHT